MIKSKIDARERALEIANKSFDNSQKFSNEKYGCIPKTE